MRSVLFWDFAQHGMVISFLFSDSLQCGMVISYETNLLCCIKPQKTADLTCGMLKLEFPCVWLRHRCRLVNKEPRVLFEYNDTILRCDSW